MIEAPVLAAMVTASATLVSKVVDWIGKRDDGKGAVQAKKVVDEAYDQLRVGFTDGCVRVLKILEGGENKMISQVREKLYPDTKLPSEFVQVFDSEFRYRLEFLRHCGAVALIGGSEYGITRVGQAFLAEARHRKDYYAVLVGDG